MLPQIGVAHPSFESLSSSSDSPEVPPPQSVWPGAPESGRFPFGFRRGFQGTSGSMLDGRVSFSLFFSFFLGGEGFQYPRAPGHLFFEFSITFRETKIYGPTSFVTHLASFVGGTRQHKSGGSHKVPQLRQPISGIKSLSLDRLKRSLPVDLLFKGLRHP